ncbi:MAG: hypothetical protein Q8L29_00535 [archaeon]|nr:hypothetical protein [archaeon]
MAKKAVKNKIKEPVKKTDDSKLFAFLAVLLTIIGFVIAYALKKDNEYVMYYGKQGLILFIASLIVWVFVETIVPFIGLVLSPILWVAWVILWVIGIIYSLSGEMKPIPVIGQFADKIKL